MNVTVTLAVLFDNQRWVQADVDLDNMDPEVDDLEEEAETYLLDSTTLGNDPRLVTCALLHWNERTKPARIFPDVPAHD